MEVKIKVQIVKPVMVYGYEIGELTSIEDVEIVLDEQAIKTIFNAVIDAHAYELRGVVQV